MAVGMKSLGVFLGILYTASAAAIPNYFALLPASNCANITFRVRASATNTVVEKRPNTDLDTTVKVNAYFQSIPVALINSTPGNRSGTYRLSGSYCVPSSEANGYRNAADRFSSPPLQLLVHGASHTKEYWDLGAWGDTNSSYSWRGSANSAGYATLAIDRLGNGESTHPDPFLDVQLPLQMEAIHSLIVQIKAGLTPIPKPRGVIFVGHSSGSILGADLAETYPGDVEAVVLTAYAPGIYSSQNATVAQQYAPAAISDPQRFGNLSYGYFLSNSLSTLTATRYYQGHYDPAIPPKDYATRGVQPIGEAFNAAGLRAQPSYKGKVLVVTGARDQIVCGNTPAAQCSRVPDAVMKVNSTFSSSTGFEYYVPPDAGHDLNWHYNALTTFDVTFQKLDYLLGRSSAGFRLAQPASIDQK